MKKYLSQLKQFSKNLLGKMIITAAVVLTAGGTLWAMAAFTEPTTGPAASVQDFAKNIWGANNDNNEFDSGSVILNDNGSIIERIEYLQAKNSGTVTALSAYNSQNCITHAQAALYCYNLSASAQYTIDGSSTSTTYTDWRLPTISELAIFEGLTSDNYMWTASNINTSWFRLSANGIIDSRAYNDCGYTRCVR